MHPLISSMFTSSLPADPTLRSNAALGKDASLGTASDLPALEALSFDAVFEMKDDRPQSEAPQVITEAEPEQKDVPEQKGAPDKKEMVADVGKDDPKLTATKVPKIGESDSANSQQPWKATDINEMNLSKVIPPMAQNQGTGKLDIITARPTEVRPHMDDAPVTARPETDARLLREPATRPAEAVRSTRHKPLVGHPQNEPQLPVAQPSLSSQSTPGETKKTVSKPNENTPNAKTSGGLEPPQEAGAPLHSVQTFGSASSRTIPEAVPKTVSDEKDLTFSREIKDIPSQNPRAGRPNPKASVGLELRDLPSLARPRHMSQRNDPVSRGPEQPSDKHQIDLAVGAGKAAGTGFSKPTPEPSPQFFAPVAPRHTPKVDRARLDIPNDAVVSAQSSFKTLNFSPTPNASVVSAQPSPKTLNLSPRPNDAVVSAKFSPKTLNLSPTPDDAVVLAQPSPKTLNLSPTINGAVVPAQPSPKTLKLSPTPNDAVVSTKVSTKTLNLSKTSNAAPPQQAPLQVETSRMTQDTIDIKEPGQKTEIQTPQKSHTATVGGANQSGARRSSDGSIPTKTSPMRTDITSPKPQLMGRAVFENVNLAEVSSRLATPADHQTPVIDAQQTTLPSSLAKADPAPQRLVGGSPLGVEPLQHTPIFASKLSVSKILQVAPVPAGVPAAEMIVHQPPYMGLPHAMMTVQRAASTGSQPPVKFHQIGSFAGDVAQAAEDSDTLVSKDPRSNPNKFSSSDVLPETAPVPPSTKLKSQPMVAPTASLQLGQPWENSKDFGDPRILEQTLGSLKENLNVPQQTSASPVARHELPPMIVRQLADVIAQSPSRPVEIALSPVELGKVRLSLNMADSGIVVSLAAERPETLDLFRRNIVQLAQDLNNLGYSDISFSFAQGDADQGPAEEGPQAQTLNLGLEQEDPSETVTEINLRQGPSTGLDLRL